MFKKIFARKKFFFLSFLTICSLPYFQFPLTVQGQAQSFQRYSEIEEMPQWNKQCQRFTDGYPQTDCNQNMTSLDSQTKKSGAYSLKLQGEKSLKNIYQINLPVKPGTKYKISSWIKIQDRKCYNYLDLGYPSAFTSIDPERVSTVQHTRGIWCGMFFLKTNESGGTASNLLQPIIIDYPYISHSSWDWYYEEGFIQTSSQATSLTITFELEGFDGKMWIDGLTLQEVESFIEDKYLHIPIKYEFQGMKIKQVSQNPLFVETNAGKFIFSNNNIQLQKNNETMSTLTFSSANFLQNLQIKQEEGLVILENVNVIFSLGADSSLLTKLKNNVSLNIEGKKPNYHNFEAGVIFATDYTKGILFSPIYSPQMLQSMPYSYDNRRRDYSYNDNDFQRLGLKNWQVLSDFSQNIWKIEYSFKKGDGFVTSLFPPKEFDEKKYCKERMNQLVWDFNLNIYPNSNYSYALQKFSERFKILLLWMHQYAFSINDQNPPTNFYFNDAGQPVSPSTPGAKAVSFSPIDVAGPFTVKEKEALHRLVNEAHGKDIKVIVYMSPNFFYTSDPDKLLENLAQNLNEFNLDGIYYDGSFKNSLLKNLELFRKTRNLLKDKFYTQHNSWEDNFIPRSNHFRVPFLDAYADKIWLGEGVKKADDNTWLLNYCGRNVSNTVSLLLPELRPVDYGLSAEESKALSLSPEQQIDKQLQCKGEFGVNFSDNNRSSIRDPQFSTTISYDSRYYYDKIDSYCLKLTCGDNICDTGETIYNCPKDCAPQTNEATLIKNGNIYSCNTNYSVAQWAVDGKPFYKLHFTFDSEPAREDSENKMNPDLYLGLKYSPPQTSQIDSRKSFYFNDKTILLGTYDESLDLTNKNFSAFSSIKKDNNNDNIQVIFSLNSNGHFYCAIKNSKLFVSLRDQSGQQKTFSGITTIDQNWHSIGIVYQKPKLILYVDGRKEKEAEILLSNFQPTGTYSVGRLSANDQTYYFTGYIDDLFVTDTALTEEQVNQYQQTQHKTITLGGTASCIITKNNQKFTASVSTVPTLPGDVNQDGHVNMGDYSLFVSKYSTNDSNCDFNKNGSVDIGDYSLLISNYGR